MPSVVDLRVEIDSDDWRPGGIWIRDGVLSGYVTLRLRGHRVIDYRAVGLNNSAIALVRSALGHHTAATEATALSAPWPLFFCSGGLRNRCGVVIDFAVEHHDRNVVLSRFYGCDATAPREVVVPWRSWARAALSFATAVRRRCPPEKRGISARYLPMYRRYRTDLGLLVKNLQRAMVHRAG